MKNIVTLLIVFCFLVPVSVWAQTETGTTAAPTGGTGRDEDESPYFPGPVTSEVTYKGTTDIKTFINANMSADVKNHIDSLQLKGRRSVLILLVNEKGKLVDAFIPKGKGIDPIIDNELVRIIRLTEWTPAYVKDKPVARRMLLPVYF